MTVEQELRKPNQRLYQHNDDYTATKYYGRPLGDVFEPAPDGTKNEKAWGEQQCSGRIHIGGLPSSVL